MKNKLVDKLYNLLKEGKPIHTVLEEQNFIALSDAYIYAMYQQVKEQNKLRNEQLEYKLTKIRLVESEAYQSAYKTIKARENQATIDTREFKENINSLESSISVYQTIITALRVWIDYTVGGDEFFDIED